MSGIVFIPVSRKPMALVNTGRKLVYFWTRKVKLHKRTTHGCMGCRGGVTPHIGPIKMVNSNPCLNCTGGKVRSTRALYGSLSLSLSVFVCVCARARARRAYGRTFNQRLMLALQNADIF